MRVLFIIQCLLLSIGLLGQQAEDSISFVAVRSTLVRARSDLTNFCGTWRKTDRMELVARSKVQTSCNGVGLMATWDTVRNVYYISCTVDSTGIIKSNLYSDLKKYWAAQEMDKNKYQGYSDYVVFADRGFFVTSEGVIPYSFGTNSSEVELPFLLLYVKGKVYKIEVFTCYGMGCLPSFIEQNFSLKINGQLIRLDKPVKRLSEAKKLLENWSSS